MNIAKQSENTNGGKRQSRARLDGRRRAVISGLSPEIEGGRFAIKRTVGETVVVEADIFSDGHDRLSAALLYRHEGEKDWAETPMEVLGNDRWRGRFQVRQLGAYRYTVLAWVDHFKSWQHDLLKKTQARQDVTVELLVGAQMVEAAAGRAIEEDATQLGAWAKALAGDSHALLETCLKLALSSPLAEMMGRYPDRRLSTAYDKCLRVLVDPELARCSAWYE